MIQAKTHSLPIVKDNVPEEPIVPPRPSKPAFTPFLSVFKDVASAPPSPSGSVSSRRDDSKRKSPPPNTDVNAFLEGDADRRRKRTRDAVSPSSSTASFQTASSRIDEGMSRNKQSRKLADRLNDKPSERASQVQGAADASQAGSSSKSMNYDNDDPASKNAEDGRISSDSMDMDIDDDQSPPKKADQAKLDPIPNGAAAFNPDQNDFMALDVSDDDDDDFRPPGFTTADSSRGRDRGRTPPQAFPNRGPSDKGKAKATGEVMVCGSR